jgi:hypothetical protein
VQAKSPFFTFRPQAGHARLPLFVTTHMTPRMTSTSAQRKIMSPIPIPVPIASPALHASAYSEFEQLLSDAALMPTINQMTNKTCTARMTQVSGRHDGMVDLLWAIGQ